MITLATERGIPVPAFSSALSWYDGYRRERGRRTSCSVCAAIFGTHTYRRTNRENTFHNRWGRDGDEVRTDA